MTEAFIPVTFMFWMSGSWEICATVLLKMRLILPQARHFWHRAANARRNAQHVLISCSVGADASEIGMPLEATAFAQRISSSLPMCFRACILLHIFWYNKTDKEILPESSTASGRIFILPF